MGGDLAGVLRCYELGELRSTRRIERGFVDDNWWVETVQGRYFLKHRHPRRRQSERLIHAQHELMARLRQAGFPAPAIVPTITGETFVVVDDQLYELAEYIEGEPYDHARPTHLDAAARTLGRYHTLVEGFAPQALRERAALYCPANSRKILSRLRRVWRLHDDTPLVWLAQRLDEQMERLAARFDGHAALPWLVIHGDYYAGNLLFDGDYIVGVVDFDKANWQPRIAEVAEALIYFASPRPGPLAHLVYPGFLERQPLARFLRGYARAATLSEDEIGALPDYVCCIWLFWSLRRLLEGSAWRPPEAAAALEEVLALGDWASTHALRMIEIAHAAMAESS